MGLVMEAGFDAIKSNIAQEPGMSGPWIKEVVKKEKIRANIDILGISELKWTGMGEFNSDDHFVYDCGRNSLEEME